MDAIVVVSGDGLRAACRKLRDVRRGDQVVCGTDGIRIVPEFQERDRQHFAFMANDISSERRVEATVARIALNPDQVAELVEHCEPIAQREPATRQRLSSGEPLSELSNARIKIEAALAAQNGGH